MAVTNEHETAAADSRVVHANDAHAKGCADERVNSIALPLPLVAQIGNTACGRSMSCKTYPDSQKISSDRAAFNAFAGNGAFLQVLLAAVMDRMSVRQRRGGRCAKPGREEQERE
jgi:hypothetical protein